MEYDKISFNGAGARELLVRRYRKSAAGPPRNNPNFEKLAWTSAKFRYFVIEDLGGRRIARTLDLKSEVELSSIKKSMRVKSIGPNNLGVADGSQIVMSDGEEWSVQFVFEDRFDVQLVPESVAREHCVLPVALADGKLKLVLPTTVDDVSDKTIDILRFVLGRDFDYDTAPRDPLFKIVDLHYLASYSEIQNCDVRFRFKCPKQWADLQPTADKLIRHCDTCDHDVYYCYSKEELNERAEKNHCVAFCDYDDVSNTLGLPDVILDP